MIPRPAVDQPWPKGDPQGAVLGGEIGKICVPKDPHAFYRKKKHKTLFASSEDRQMGSASRSPENWWWLMIDTQGTPMSMPSSFTFAASDLKAGLAWWRGRFDLSTSAPRLQTLRTKQPMGGKGIIIVVVTFSGCFVDS